MRRNCSLALSRNLGLRWSQWLLAEFGDSTAAVADGMRVSRETARQWLEGGEPRARHLVYALTAFPRAVGIILGDDDA